jgi:LPXTG-site transpeptidase (sortase) family protein
MAGGAASFLAGVILLAVGFMNLAGGGSAPPKGPPVVDLGIDASFLRTTNSPTNTPAPTGPTPTPAPPLGDSPYEMIIEKIGVRAPVDTYGLDENAVPEVPTGDDAAEVVAWYNFSAKPGTGSNAVFAGHVTWFGPAVFYNLTSLAPGDVIKLKNDQGTELAYTVTSVFSVDPNDPDSLKVMAGTDKDVITIITCDGTFTHTNDPVFGGEYSNRLVVRGELAKVTVAGSAQAPSAGG